MTSANRGANDIYFVSSKSGSTDIYRAAGFVPPIAVAELNTTSEELSPVVSADDKTILWSSRRTDGGPQGGADIWEARRANTAGPFANLRRVTELNTEGNDTPTWISESGCRLYLNRACRTKSTWRPDRADAHRARIVRNQRPVLQRAAARKTAPMMICAAKPMPAPFFVAGPFAIA